MKRNLALSTIGHAARQARAELEHRGMTQTSHALAVLSGATMAIGSHVRGWQSELTGMMHPVIARMNELGAAGGGHRKRRKSTKPQKLTRKQIAAGFGGKRRQKGKSKRKVHHKTRRHLTAAQKRAGFGGKRSMHGKRRKKVHKPRRKE